MVSRAPGAAQTPKIGAVVFWAPCFFGGLGYPGPKIRFVQEDTGVLALPPTAARPINQYFPKQVLFFGLGTPGLQNTTWPKNHYGILLSVEAGLS